MPFLRSAFAGLALSATLAGCNEPKDWVCEVGIGSIVILDKAGKDGRDLYWAFDITQERDRYTGLRTLKSTSVWAYNASAFSGKMSQDGAYIRAVIGSHQKVESCTLRTRDGNYAIKTAYVLPLN
ncbi:MAG: hypothetical protein V4621_03380 [Pseudomonadota bacterium]